jgi:hypothetical protein
MSSWAQFILALALAGSGAIWWSGGLGARVDANQRHSDEQFKILASRYELLDSEITDLKLNCERIKASCPTRVDGLEARVGVLERLLGNLTDLAPLVRDSNNLQRQRMQYDGSHK